MYMYLLGRDKPHFVFLVIALSYAVASCSCFRDRRWGDVGIPQSDNGSRVHGTIQGKVVVVRGGGIKIDDEANIPFARFRAFMELREQSIVELTAKNKAKSKDAESGEYYVVCDSGLSSIDVLNTLQSLAACGRTTGLYLITTHGGYYYSRMIPICGFPEKSLNLVVRYDGSLWASEANKAFTSLESTNIDRHRGVVLYCNPDVTYGQLINAWDRVLQNGFNIVTLGRDPQNR